jgi:glycerol-3-phosphate dehydrogenase
VRELGKERVPEPVARHLVDTYGAESAAVANLAAREPALGRPLLDGWPVLQAEVVYQARREMALTVADVLIRRTHLFHRDPSQGTGAAPVVAGLLARELGWDAGREAESLAAYLDEVKRMRRQVMTPPAA